MRVRSKLFASGVAAIALIGAVQPAHAQDSDDASIQEGQPEAGEGGDRYSLNTIVVTARRVSESLQDTPISVTAITAEALADKGASDLTSLDTSVPNVNFSTTGTSSGSSSAAVIFIRGVGQNDFIPTTEPGVGLYVDGVYYGRTVGSVLDLLDLEQVEVLRGPQGTLFGRNTIGGAINLTTRKPDFDLGGKIRVLGGSDDRYEGFVSVDAPLGPTLAMGVAGMIKKRDGYVEREDGVRQGGEDVLGGRFNLLWEPNDQFEARLTADYVREREESAPEVLLNAIEGAAFPTFFNTNAFGNGATDPTCAVNGGAVGNRNCYNDSWVLGPYSSGETGPSNSEIDAWGVALNMQVKLTDTVTLKSISAYRELDANLARSADGSPFTIFQTQDEYVQNQFSEELQLIANAFEDRLSLVAGGYFFTESASNFAFVEFVPPTSPLRIGADVENENFALFGEATLDVTDRLHLLGGVRYTKEIKRFQGTSLRGFGGTPNVSILSGDAALPQTLEFGKVTWRGSLSYDVTDDITTYATVSTGFKSGGFTLRLTNPNTIIPTFDPETVTLYEIGAKTEFPAIGLRLNLSGFMSDYTDIQVDGVVPGAFGTVTFNGGDAEINGVEAELTWVPTGDLNINASFGYLDAKYTSLNAGSLVTLADKLIRTPKYTASAGASYYFDLGDAGSITPRVDWAYKSRIEFEPVNTAFTSQPGYSTVNVNIGYLSPNEDWRVNLGVENLTDKRYLIAGDSNPTIGYDLGVFARPRNWYVSLEKTF